MHDTNTTFESIELRFFWQDKTLYFEELEPELIRIPPDPWNDPPPGYAVVRHPCPCSRCGQPVAVLRLVCGRATGHDVREIEPGVWAASPFSPGHSCKAVSQ